MNSRPRHRRYFFKDGCKHLENALFFIFIMTATLFAALVATSPVQAHKVNVYAYVDVDKLIVEGYFGGKAAAVDCPVELFDGEGKKILEGRTDDKGVWSVKLAELPAIKGDILVVLAAGSGHRADYTVPAADLAALKAIPMTQAEEAGNQPKQSITPNPIPASKVSEDSPAQPKSAALAISEQALTARLDRMEAMLSTQQKILMEQKNKGPSMSEIIGGIGWIFGIVGIAAYFLSRKRVNGTDAGSEK